MSTLHYTTNNETASGRASHFYKDQEHADLRCQVQNSKAEGMALSAHYSVRSCTSDDIKPSDIRA